MLRQRQIKARVFGQVWVGGWVGGGGLGGSAGLRVASSEANAAGRRSGLHPHLKNRAVPFILN